MDKFKVLVIENSHFNEAIICDILKEIGLIPITLKSDDDLFEILKRENIEIIITNLINLHFEGTQFIETIKSVHPKIPIIVLTSITDKDKAIEALNSGADEYILKPINKEEIQIAVIKCYEFSKYKYDSVLYLAKFQEMYNYSNDLKLENNIKVNKILTPIRDKYSIRLYKFNSDSIAPFFTGIESKNENILGYFDIYNYSFINYTLYYFVNYIFNKTFSSANAFLKKIKVFNDDLNKFFPSNLFVNSFFIKLLNKDKDNFYYGSSSIFPVILLQNNEVSYISSNANKLNFINTENISKDNTIKPLTLKTKDKVIFYSMSLSYLFEENTNEIGFDFLKNFITENKELTINELYDKLTLKIESLISSTKSRKEDFSFIIIERK